ncbi:MAG: hypothetical protein LBQ36_00165 [Synergistaceae bacterium]|jgi:hypothetical protein|nr:hypothetical protein [Synergistaceae bacterium]
MQRKIIFGKFSGWVLAELLSCAIIVMFLAGSVLQSTDGMARMFRWMRMSRSRIEDYSSIASEINAWAISSDVAVKGPWKATINYREGGFGCEFADVSVVEETEGTPVAIAWKLWRINGRK